MRSASTRSGGWIDTWSGRKFYPLDPQPSDIDIGDIAASLANQCRFGGHTREFYSVAQHCVHVAEQLLSFGNPDIPLWGLLHDAAEAYLLDLPRPIKKDPAMAAYRRAEVQILQAVAQRFSLPWSVPELVHAADEQLLATEMRDLMDPRMAEFSARVVPLAGTIQAWSPSVARARYLETFWELQARREASMQEFSFPACPLLQH